MPSPNLPNALLKFGLALAKHYVKKVIGDEALQEIATTAADISGEEVKAKVDSILGNKEGEKQLLKAAKAADKNFIKKCKDKDFRELFTMEHGDLPSVQTAIAKLPKELDDEALHETLFKVFREELPKRVSDEQVKDGVNLYVTCLQDALLPVKDFGLHVLHSELKEIGKDVKKIKGNVDFLVEKAKAISQGVVDSKNYARFLVPFPHNPDFVGREAELASLHEMLQKKESIVGIRPTVLVGLGGIGKTQLVVEYAHAYRDDYPSGVFWLNAINPLLFEFSDLAEKLEMADRDTPRDKAARKVWDYLDSHPDTLVVFDNVLEPSQLNATFSPDLVPANLRCRTLFTTRQRDFPRNFQPFEVKILPEMAAMKLLLRSRPEVLDEHHPEWGWARIVCAELGWLPLALELASAYLGAYSEVSITGYLERLRTEGRLETVDESEVRAIDLPTRVEEILKAAAAGSLAVKHQIVVSATLQTQWKRLEDEDTKLLFRVAGQFPEASWIPIPRLGLLTGIDSEAKAGHPSPLSIALKKLHAVSLIEELSEDRLRLHPLVQEFAARLPHISLFMEMADRVAKEFSDLMRLQTRVIHYGVDMVLEDLRTAISFCMDQPKHQTYFLVSKLERILDRQAHGLRNWNPQEHPAFFVQQIRNDASVQELEHWQVQVEAELAQLGKPYILERFPISSDLAELRTLTGHEGHIGVGRVALSANGVLSISGSENTIRVWDVTTGRELRTLTGHNDYVFDVALSADGRLAVSASNDVTRNLKVWDVTTGREIRTLEGHYGAVEHVALSADGQLALSISGSPAENHTLKVWDVTTGCELRTLAGHSSSIYDVALSADGRLAVSASQDNTLKVWDVTTGRELRTLVGHTGWVYRVALSVNGQLAVSYSDDHTIKVWGTATGLELSTLTEIDQRVNDLALSADGRLVVLALEDGTLRVWEVHTGRELHTLTGHSGSVKSIALSADGLLILSASEDNTLKVWDISTMLNTSNNRGHEFKELAKHRLGVVGVALGIGGRLAISASYDAVIKMWDVVEGRDLNMFQAYHQDFMGMLCGFAVSTDGRLVVAADMKTLMVWDSIKGRELCTIPTGHNFMVNDIALSADGRLAVSASMDNTLKVWDLRTGREQHTLAGHSDSVNCVALSADGRLAISASDDNTLKVWDIRTGCELRTLSRHSQPVSDVALGANGQLGVSVLQDHSLKVWNVASGQCIAIFMTGFLLECCALSADGKTIVAGDRSGGIHFFELIGANEFQTPEVKIEKSWLVLNEEVEARSLWLPRWLKGLLRRRD